MKTKQVIVIRKDLNMRKGKIAAQAAHASMGVFSKNWYLKEAPKQFGWEPDLYKIEHYGFLNKAVKDWLENSFTKICVYVNSEVELLELQSNVARLGLLHHLVTDNGLTEFNGVPTVTCLAIGPDYNEKIDPITQGLPLL